MYPTHWPERSLIIIGAVVAILLPIVVIISGPVANKIIATARHRGSDQYDVSASPVNIAYCSAVE